MVPGGVGGESEAQLEQQGHKQVHGESEPYHEPGAGKTVDFNYAVGDDVAQGKYHESGGNGERAKLHGFDFHKVGHNYTHAEEHCQKQKHG